MNDENPHINVELPVEHQWINTVSLAAKIWRSRFEEEFKMVAVSINGLHVAYEKYKNKPPTEGFTIKGIRNRKIVVISTTEQSQAAQLHMASQPVILEAGIIVLYSFLEQSIRDFFEIYYIIF